MGILSRLAGLFSPAEHAAREADREFGTGVWRQHHDRFMRAVDRFGGVPGFAAERDGGLVEAVDGAHEPGTPPKPPRLPASRSRLSPHR